MSRRKIVPTSALVNYPGGFGVLDKNPALVLHYPGGFGELDKYPALVLHYSGVLLLRFPRILIGESYYSTRVWLVTISISGRLVTRWSNFLRSHIPLITYYALFGQLASQRVRRI
jgi:hypothetical protein